MRRSSRFPIALLILPLLTWANLPARAAEDKAKDQPKFLRFVPEGNDGGRLETAISTYKNDKGQTVHLVGAVHIADAGYYQALNKLFEGYDVLLYEMVKPENTGAPVKAQGVGFVHMIQKGLKMFLDLDYQLDGINYQAKNFVHADLTAEEFNRMQDERGESIFGMMIQQMIREFMKGDTRRNQEDLDPMALLAALQSEDGARQLKLILAKQFNNMDEMIEGMEGPNGSVLLTERNKAALKVLKQELDAGKKNIGLFYGAAHLKDMDKRLVNDMGFKRAGTEWRVAWDLSPKGAAKVKNPDNRGGQVVPDERDEQIRKLMERIEALEKKLDEKGKR